MPPTMLLIDDSPRALTEFEELFTQNGWEVRAYESVEEARNALESNWNEIDIAVLDYDLRHGVNGLEFAQALIRESGGRVATALLTAEGSEALAVTAIKDKRLDDYFVKHIRRDNLVHRCKILQEIASVRRESMRLEVENRRLKATLLEAARHGKSGRVNVDPKIVRTVYDIRTVIAPSLMPVLILGDTGTGKEDIAREIHESSGLDKDNFRVVNCGGLSDTLILSELFGHVKGSFSDATYHKLGLVLEAAGIRVHKQMGRNDTIDYLAWLKSHCLPGDEPKQEPNSNKRVLRFGRLGCSETAHFSGTLFLDEVADLLPRAQNALLRFLDGNGLLPVGYNGIPLAPKVRVVAATNRVDHLLGQSVPPDPMDKSDTVIPGFRTDLLWRLTRWVVWLPPLHEREIDDPLVIAMNRAEQFGRQDDVPSRYRSFTFRFAAGAVEELRRMIDEREFSGDVPLKSGNLRNLLGLVDRACWLTMTGAGIDLQSQHAIQGEQSLEISEEVLQEAAKSIVELAEHAKRREKPAFLGQAEAESARPSHPERNYSTDATANLPDASFVNNAKQRSGRRLDALNTHFTILCSSTAWHPARFSQDDKQLDVDVIRTLAVFVLEEMRDYHKRSVGDWFAEPWRMLGTTHYEGRLP